MLAFVALLGACGGHWLALQSIAWGTMIIDYAKEAGVAAAISKTFDGENPCAICKNIEQGKKTEKKAETGIAISRLEFFHDAQQAHLTQPDRFRVLTVPLARSHSRSEPPLLRPPRGA